MSNTQRALDAFFYTRLPPVLTRFLCVGGICIIVNLIKRCSVRKGVKTAYVCQTRNAPLTPFSILAFPPFFLSISYNCALDYLLIAHRAVLSIFMFLGN